MHADIIARLENPTPEMIAAVWKELRRAHLPRLGPGPGVVEAIRALGRALDAGNG